MTLTNAQQAFINWVQANYTYTAGAQDVRLRELLTAYRNDTGKAAPSNYVDALNAHKCWVEGVSIVHNIKKA